MANYAYEKHKNCFRNLSISASSSAGDIMKALDIYWNNMVMDVTEDISDIREKEIYRALINQSRYAVKVSECYEEPVVEVKFDGTYKVDTVKNISLGLAFAAAAFCAVWYIVVSAHLITGGLALAAFVALSISVFCSKVGSVFSKRFAGKKAFSKVSHNMGGIALFAKFAALIIAAAGALINFLPVQMSLFRGRIMLLMVIFIALSMVLDFVKKLQEPAYTAVAKTKLNTDAVFKVLEEAAVGIDANAARIAAALPAPVLDPSELGFIRELSKIKTMDQVYSLLDYYIAKNGITKVEYSPDTAYLFNLMPSTDTRTLEPALIKGVDEIIYTGTALVREEEV